MPQGALMNTLHGRNPAAGRTVRQTILALTLALAAVAGCRFETGAEEDLEDSIRALMSRSAAAWNAGDLDGYMEAFADGASTSFVTAEGPVYGRPAIRALYAPRFEPGAERDSLRLEELSIRPLPPLIGIVTGRFVLEDDDGVSATGWFSVVVRRAGEGWRIVHDHSS